MEAESTNKKIIYPKIKGIYNHYKGGKYKVLTMATHSETNERLVITKSMLFGDIKAWPLEKFFELVENDKKFKVERFILEQ